LEEKHGNLWDSKPQVGETIISLRRGLPDLLALGDRGEALPLFGTDDKLRAFVRAHPSLQAQGCQSVEAALLGANLFEVAELISPAVEAGRAELVVFDPVLDANEVWIGQSLSWPAESFCGFMRGVMDIARRKEGVPEGQIPSSKAINKAYCWYTWRMLAYVYGPSRIYRELKQILGLKD